MFQQMTQQVCEKCPNVKYVWDGFEVTVDIQKGKRHGEEVVFYEDGEPIIDGEPGDLKFRIRTTPHDVFKREGNDLHTTVTVTLAIAETVEVGTETAATLISTSNYSHIPWSYLPIRIFRLCLLVFFWY